MQKSKLDEANAFCMAKILFQNLMIHFWILTYVHIKLSFVVYCMFHKSALVINLFAPLD